MQSSLAVQSHVHARVLLSIWLKEQCTQTNSMEETGGRGGVTFIPRATRQANRLI